MEFNLEKAIADYANEAMNMSRRSADYLTVPKPEPPPMTKSEKPETKTETKSKTKTKPQIKNQSKGGKAASKSVPETSAQLTEEEEFLLNGFDDIIIESLVNDIKEINSDESESGKESESKKAEEVPPEENSNEDEQGEPVKEKDSDNNSEKDSENESDTKPEKSPPSFDDYIGRRNRSWERGTTNSPNGASRANSHTNSQKSGGKRS